MAVYCVSFALEEKVPSPYNEKYKLRRRKLNINIFYEVRYEKLCVVGCVGDDLYDSYIGTFSQRKDGEKLVRMRRSFAVEK